MATFAEHYPLHEEYDVEDSRVRRWRFDEFSALGFGDEDAVLLAVSDADLHRARVIVGAGCPLHLALKILT